MDGLTLKVSQSSRIFCDDGTAARRDSHPYGVVGLFRFAQLVRSSAHGLLLASTAYCAGMENSSGGSQSHHAYRIERTGAPSAPPTGDADAAREKLESYRLMCATRDGLVIEAKTSGLTEVEIAQLAGHSRNTIRSILAKHGESTG